MDTKCSSTGRSKSYSGRKSEDAASVQEGPSTDLQEITWDKDDAGGLHAVQEPGGVGAVQQPKPHEHAGLWDSPLGQALQVALGSRGHDARPAAVLLLDPPDMLTKAALPHLGEHGCQDHLHSLDTVCTPTLLPSCNHSQQGRGCRPHVTAKAAPEGWSLHDTSGECVRESHSESHSGSSPQSSGVACGMTQFMSISADQGMYGGWLCPSSLSNGGAPGTGSKGPLPRRVSGRGPLL